MPSLARVLLAALSVTFSVVAVGCPAREVSIVFTQQGTAFFLTACEPKNEGCGLGTRSRPDFVSTPLQARLFLISPKDRRVRDASRCMTIGPCSQALGRNGCLAAALNQQLDGAIPGGLGFDGLRTPEEGELLLAFYQPPTTTSDDPPCADNNLLACTGLAPPLGGGNYDITCASCQGGTRISPGRDSTPCPAEGNVCFLQTCNSLVRAESNQ